MIGLDWIGLDCFLIELDWFRIRLVLDFLRLPVVRIGLLLIGLDRIGLDYCGVEWIGLDWIRLVGIGFGWV